MPIPIEETYHYCPRCGTKNDAPGKIPFRCGECQMTLFFGPVAAVGGLIVNASNELLLVRRARDPGKGQWGLPGGFVDRGETIEQALEREVYEETQLRLVSEELFLTYPNHYNYHGVLSQVIDLFYICRAVDTEDIKLEPTELDAFVWAEPDQTHLENMAFVSNRHAIECWMKLT